MAAVHPSRRPTKPSNVPKIKSDPKPKPKPKPSSSSGDGSSTTRVAAAMRAVNAASQTLSGLVQSGWRAGSGKKSSEAVGAGENASKELRELRAVCMGDVDVERAASSVVGKLIVLELVRLDIILLVFLVANVHLFHWCLSSTLH
jgi:hypothetical protein